MCVRVCVVNGCVVYVVCVCKKNKKQTKKTVAVCAFFCSCVVVSVSFRLHFDISTQKAKHQLKHSLNSLSYKTGICMLCAKRICSVRLELLYVLSINTIVHHLMY